MIMRADILLLSVNSEVVFPDDVIDRVEANCVYGVQDVPEIRPAREEIS